MKLARALTLLRRGLRLESMARKDAPFEARGWETRKAVERVNEREPRRERMDVEIGWYVERSGWEAWTFGFPALGELLRFGPSGSARVHINMPACTYLTFQQ